MKCLDESNTKLTALDLNWSEEFVNISEIVLVLRKNENLQNDQRLILESNLVVNGKFMKKSCSSFLKSNGNVKSEMCNPALLVYGPGEGVEEEVLVGLSGDVSPLYN